MVTSDSFRELALSFPGTEEKPHFDRAGFKVIDKRIFATLHEKSHTANLRLPVTDQQVYCGYGKNIIYPVPNKWGQKGWTTFVLKDVPRELLFDALEKAYRDVLKPGGRKKDR